MTNFSVKILSIYTREYSEIMKNSKISKNKLILIITSIYIVFFWLSWDEKYVYYVNEKLFFPLAFNKFFYYDDDYICGTVYENY